MPALPLAKSCGAGNFVFIPELNMKFSKVIFSASLIFLFVSAVISAPFSSKTNFYLGDVFFPVYGADTELSVNKDDSSCTVSGGFFSAKPDLGKFSAGFYSGWEKVEVNSSKIDFSVGAFGANIPGETKILNGSPRFTLKDGEFLGVSSSFGYHFSEKISFELSVIAANGGFGWGDLYYFYGHPSKNKIYGEKLSVFFPLDFELFALGGSVKVKIRADNTETYASLGQAGANLAVFGAKKTFFKDRKSNHSFDTTAFFVYADFFGSVYADPETQSYFFFPYEKIRGKVEGRLYAAGGGFSYGYSRSSFEAGIDLYYLHCFSNPSDSDYSYKYKKNIFFDGSSKSADFDFIDFSRCGIFTGELSLSYNFKKLFSLKRAEPKLKFARIFALPLLTDSARGKLHFSSSKSSSSDGGLSSTKGLDKLKTVLLAGTVVSLKIEY